MWTESYWTAPGRGDTVLCLSKRLEQLEVLASELPSLLNSARLNLTALPDCEQTNLRLSSFPIEDLKIEVRRITAAQVLQDPSAMIEDTLEHRRRL